MSDNVFILVGLALACCHLLRMHMPRRPFRGSRGYLRAVSILGVSAASISTAAALVTWIFSRTMLTAGQAERLRLSLFVLIAATLAVQAELLVRRRYPLLFPHPEVFIALVVACALTLWLFGVDTGGPLTLAWYGLAAMMVGVLVLFAALSESIDRRQLPRPLAGAPADLCAAGLMSLAGMGLAGLV